MPETSPVRIAVVGAGTITQSVHLPALKRLGRSLRLTAVCDLSPTRAARVAAEAGEGVRAFHELDALLADGDVDAVLLATPGTHATAARAALEAGKHVLAEKPLCLTVAEAEELSALAAERGLVLQVGYMKLYDPVLPAAARELAELDTPRTVRVTVLHPADEPQVEHLRMGPPDTDVDTSVIAEANAYEAARTAEALGDVPEELGAYYRNVLNGSVIHELSVLRGLGLGLPRTFDAAALWPWPVSGEPPCLLADGELPGGARLVLNWNWLPDHPEYGEEITVLARDGRLHLDMAAPYLVDVRSTLRVEKAAKDGSGLRSDSVVRPGYDTGFVLQLEAFAASVADGAPVLSDAAGAADDVRALQALLTAVARAQGIEVGGEAARHAKEGN
ncbi:Gfo/Idh/MocA family protein [Streptomyces sp. NPDC048172]|uniref:Gfo/Idh/MocA family protein n=1 Tax=Streptomyces sp. NPDC048172 TaxID=3365505 RepID=UPI003722888B